MPPKSSVESIKDASPTNLRRLSATGLNVTSKQLTIIVGERNVTRMFYMHEKLATEHAEFFAAALRKGWKEAEERTVYLPDDRPELFEVFARFAYSGKIQSCVEGDRTTVGVDKEWIRLVNCWILGDKLGSITFKDAIVDALCDKLNETNHYPSDVFRNIYTNSLSSATVRRLMVDIAIWRFDAKTIENSQLGETWNEFFRDLAVKLFELSEAERKGPAPFKEPGCKYHEHVAVASPCYKTMF